MIDFGRFATGVSFDTGCPFLVMMISSPLLATSSMSLRQRALNSEALMMRFLMTMVITMVTRSQALRLLRL